MLERAQAFPTVTPAPLDPPQRWTPRRRSLRRRSTIPFPDPPRRRVLRRRALRRRSPPSDPLRRRVGRQGRERWASQTLSPLLHVLRCDWSRAPSESQSLPTRSSRSTTSCPQASSPRGAGSSSPIPTFNGAASTVGGAIDCRGHPVAPATHRPAGSALIIRCGLLYRRGQGEADRLCVPEGGC